MLIADARIIPERRSLVGWTASTPVAAQPLTPRHEHVRKRHAQAEDMAPTSHTATRRVSVLFGISCLLCLDPRQCRCAGRMYPDRLLHRDGHSLQDRSCSGILGVK